MKPKPNKDWLAALEGIIGSSTEAPGPEWKTREQVQTEFNLTKHQAHRVLGGLVKTNKVDVKFFMVTLNKLRRPTPHYRLK